MLVSIKSKRTCPAPHKPVVFPPAVQAAVSGRADEWDGGGQVAAVGAGEVAERLVS